MSADPATAAAYERQADEWAAARTNPDLGPARRLCGTDDTDGRVLDVGCGPGSHLASLPARTVGLDPVAAMLALARGRAPDADLVQGEAGALPFQAGAFDAALASKSLVHIPRPSLPMALAELHRVLRVGAPAELVMFGGDEDFAETGGPFAGRRFALWERGELTDVLEGAGFAVTRFVVVDDGHWPRYEIGLRRLRSLPDFVGPGMRLLVCGLNPSLHAADTGVGFAGPGNRFWPAALAAGVASLERDPRHALASHGLGMTDLVKRATPRAAEITADEFRAGVARLERVCRRLTPGAVCVVGLTGWRQGVDRGATAGWQHHELAGAPVYVMPSTSGLNAHARLRDLTDHLRAAAAGP